MSINRHIKLYRLSNCLAAAIAVSLFIRCSFSPDLAGTATETTNGYVLSSGGIPVVNAPVRVIDVDHWFAHTIEGVSVVFDSTCTDSNGWFTVEAPRFYASNLQIDSKEEGLLVFDVDDSLTKPACTLSLILKPCAELRGTVESISSLHQELLLFGSTYRMPIGSDNGFHAANISEGAFALIVLQQSSETVQTALAGAVTLTAGESVNTGSISADAERIPVEDFLQGWIRTVLGRVIGGGWWYSFLDTSESGNSTLIASIQSIGSFDSNSLQAIVCLNGGMAYPYGGIGFHVGQPDSKGYDFSHLKKLTFMAKGRGTIDVALQTRALDIIPGNWDHFSMQITLSPDWTAIEIPVDSLRLIPGSPADSSGITWLQASKSLLRVQFTALHRFNAIGDTVEYWLDDIAFEGVDISKLSL